MLIFSQNKNHIIADGVDIGIGKYKHKETTKEIYTIVVKRGALINDVMGNIIEDIVLGRYDSYDDAKVELENIWKSLASTKPFEMNGVKSTTKK